MADAEHTNLPAGVSIGREYSGGIEYHGTESDLIAAGVLQPEGLVGIKKHSRQIALKPEGGFVLVGEGKGNHLTLQHRQHGAFTVKRLPDGLVSVFKYRTKAEAKELDRLSHERYLREQEQATWQQAKVARSQDEDFRQRWMSGVLGKLDELESLIDGRCYFTDFPKVSIHSADVAAAKRVVEELRNVLRWAKPSIKDLVVRSNVVALDGKAYRYMGKATA